MIGSPLAFFHHYTRPPRPSAPAAAPAEVPERVRWRMDRARSGGGMVMDSGFHYCDSIRYLMGDVDKVYAQARAIGFRQAHLFG